MRCRCRRRTAKVLESSPLQIALCVLVILDAGIVLSEILIDLHAMRSQSLSSYDDLITHHTITASHFCWKNLKSRKSYSHPSPEM